MTRWRTLAAVDFDERACATYRVNFQDVEVICSTVGDALPRLPACDVLLGGPPCQSFSTAGKGMGDDDGRNAWPEMIEAARKLRPRMFLAENVPGMLTERHMGYTASVLADLERAGYRVETRLLDAVNFGVPQFRKRLWWWGIRRDVDARHVWPEPTHQWPAAEPGGLFGDVGLPTAVTVGEALGIGPYRVERLVEHSGPRAIYEDIADKPCTTVSGARPGDNQPFVAIRRIRGAGCVRRDHPIDEPSPTVMAPTGGKAGLCAVEYRWSAEMAKKHPPAALDAPCPTVQAKWFKGGAEGLVECSVLDRPAPTVLAGQRGKEGGSNCVADKKWRDSFGRLCAADTLERPADTISGGGTANGWAEPIAHARRQDYVRRLTPDECARLQSCPDDMAWPEKITKTAKYRIIGNGWSCGMAAALSEALGRADPESVTVVSLFCGGGLGDLGWHGRFWRMEHGTE